MSNIDIGERLKSIRLEKGYTLDEVAAAVGVAKSTIQRYEAGKISSIKLPVIESIARFLNVNPAWVIGKSAERHLPMHFVSYVTSDNHVIEIHNPQEIQRNEQLQLARLSAYYGFLQEYLKLNDTGKEKLHEQLRLLSKIPEYQDDTENNSSITLNAAHERTDIETTTEDRLHDNDIMDDENFED